MVVKNKNANMKKMRVNFSILLSSIATQTYANVNDKYNTALLFDVDYKNISNLIDNSQDMQSGYYDIYMNGEYIFSDDVVIEENNPCISVLALNKMELVDKLRNEIEEFSNRGVNGCYIITDEFFKKNIDKNSLILRFIVPQSELKRLPKNYIDPNEYYFGDDGLYVNYSANKYLVKRQSGYDTSDHLRIDSSLNIKGWYLRHSGYYDDDEYVSYQTYVSRVVPDLQSVVKLGEYNTSGRAFTTVPMEGIGLEYKAEMLPSSRQGYAPTIRGTAATSAIVIIEQNDLEIYRETVPPGDFVINDLYPLGFGSDLMVKIVESDGVEKKFRVAYNPTSRMLRQGQYHQNLYLGRTNFSRNDINVFEYNGELGFNNYISFYGGFQVADNYNSQLFGMSFGSLLGGISIDVRNSNSHLESWKNGQSYNLNWAKHIDISNSDITFSAFKYSTESYYDLGEYVNSFGFHNNVGRTKGSLSVSINQNLDSGLGNLYANISQRNFWGNNNIERQYQLGYSNSLSGINYSLSLNRTERNEYGFDTSFMINLNFPLFSNYNVTSSPTVTLSYQGNGDQKSERIGINGTYGEQSLVSYGMSAQNSDTAKNPEFSTYASYNNPYSNLNVMYSHGSNQDNYSLGLRGAIVAWDNGIAFTSQQSDTYAIAHVESAPNAIINNNRNQITDANGNALVTSIYPYRKNTIVVDDKYVDENISILGSSKTLTPVRGSISIMNFDSEYKYNVILDIITNKYFDFSTPVYDENSNIVGYIGQANKALLKLSHSKGALIIGENLCSFKYEIDTGVKIMNATCE
ncbi:fimbrial biogenesis outer membrane usher protein [Vibrio fluvialis]|nr:fimbrial biogenesis outer membrane usher protein [Vibrio fluvialis]